MGGKEEARRVSLAKTLLMKTRGVGTRVLPTIDCKGVLFYTRLS